MAKLEAPLTWTRILLPKVDTSDLDFDIRVSPSSNHKLQCFTCHPATLWCKHIKIVLVKNLDAQDLWTDNNKTAKLDGMTLSVPIFPTSDQWADVILNSVDDDKDYLAVCLDIGDFPPTTYDRFIGYLHPGEGRNVIREMAINWFQGHVDTSDLQCKAGTHKYKEEMIWQVAVKDNPLPQYWSVWVTNKCIDCAGRDGGAGFEDVVPEDATPRRRF